MVQSDNTVTVQQIQISTNNDKDTAVTGINPGTTIATSGFDRLENGVHVSVRVKRGQPGSPQPAETLARASRLQSKPKSGSKSK